MYVSMANHEEHGLGEGDTVEAFSQDLEKVKTWALATAQMQAPDKVFCYRGPCLRETQMSPEIVLVLEYRYGPDTPYDKRWYTWCVIAEDYEPTIPINLDAIHD